jgi:hypothetical protein
VKDVQELSGEDLLDALDVELETPEESQYTPRQERILAGFEDVLRFRETNGRAPGHGQHLDIFERLYAVRLDQLRKLPEENLALLRSLDRFGLLDEPTDRREPADALSAEELLAALNGDEPDDIGKLVHVQSVEARRDSPEYVAERVKCADFDLYRPLFDAAEADLASGKRVAKRFEKDASIEAGDFFVVNGQMVYVAHVGELFKAPNGGMNARLRAIYANGTESNLLLWSLQRALFKDENSRRLTQPELGPLFEAKMEEGDLVTGTIYVARSLSTWPEIAKFGDSLLKIGVTGGSVETRLRDAANDPTFLFAPVEIVATWQLANVHRFKLEKTLHRVFGAAQLQVAVPGLLNRKVEPREWFIVPLPVVDEVIRRIKDETIVEYLYDPALGQLRKVETEL